MSKLGFKCRPGRQYACLYNSAQSFPNSFLETSMHSSVHTSCSFRLCITMLFKLGWWWFARCQRQSEYDSDGRSNTWRQLGQEQVYNADGVCWCTFKSEIIHPLFCVSSVLANSSSCRHMAMFVQCVSVYFCFKIIFKL